MPERSGRGTALAVAVAVALAIVLIAPGLSVAPFDDPGEGMHAEVAREVLESGDWLSLHLNGVRYVDKPPLLYWLAALAMKAWGPAEWVVRLVPFAGTLAAIAATALLGARWLGPRGGVIAGLALLTCPGFLAYACYVRPETLFAATIQWGFTLLLGSGAATLGCVALGAASLAKDPLGTFGPLGALLAGRALARRAQVACLRLPWRGLALLAVVAAAWHVVSEIRSSGSLWYTVVDNHVLNLARARHFPDEDVPLTGLEFLTVATLGAFPWVLPAGLAVVEMVRTRVWRTGDGERWMVLATWTAGVFALFTLVPFKLPHYGLPVYPALALLAARWWERHPCSLRVLVVHLGAFAAVALACGWVAAGDVSSALDRVFQGVDVYTRKELAHGDVEAIIPWAALRPLVAWTAGVFALASVALAVTLARPARRFGVFVILAAMLGFGPLVGRALGIVAGSRAVRSLALAVAARAEPGDVLAHEGPIENSGALEFYGGRRPVIVDGRVSVLGFGSTFADARDTFWERSRLVEAWHGPRRIFLVTIREPERSVVADIHASERFLLLARNGRRLYSNRP
jgi:dolichyl-phosphate-mannose-protein mannosyltransferase